MTRLQAEIKSLAKSHPVLAQAKLERHTLRLERMARFYEEKGPDAPENQSWMFKGFASALIYSVTVIKMYRRLTRRLAAMAEDTDENRPNS